VNEHVFMPVFTPPDRPPDNIEGSPSREIFRTFWEATPVEPSLEVIEVRPFQPPDIPPVCRYDSNELGSFAAPNKPLAAFYTYVGYQSGRRDAPAANDFLARDHRIENRYPHAQYAEDRLEMLRAQHFVTRFKSIDGKFSAGSFCEAVSDNKPAFLWAANGPLARHDGLEHAVAAMLLSEEIVGQYSKTCEVALKLGQNAITEAARRYETYMTANTAIQISEALTAEKYYRQRGYHLRVYPYWAQVARSIGGLLGSTNQWENLWLAAGLRQQVYWLIDNVPAAT
jgi:hypothetical protein